MTNKVVEVVIVSLVPSAIHTSKSFKNTVTKPVC